MKEILLVVGTIVFLLNIPFGYWRANVPRLSLQWYLAIHLPVPAVIALRVVTSLGWRILTYPVLVGAFFLGQLLGGMIYRLRRKERPLTSCLIMDLIRNCRAC